MKILAEFIEYLVTNFEVNPKTSWGKHELVREINRLFTSFVKER